MIWTNRAFFDSPIYFGHSIIKHIFIWCTSTYSFKCLCSFCSIFHWLSRQKLRHFFCCYFLGILIRTNSRAVYSFQIIFFPSYATCHFNLAFLCSHTPPPSRPKFGKNLNLDIFEIIAPSLTLAKTVPKSYLTFTLGLIQLYISQIWSKCCPYLTNISPIYHQNKGHISVILIWEKVQTPLPHQKAVYILNCLNCSLLTHYIFTTCSLLTYHLLNTQAQLSSLKPQLKLSFSCILNFTPHPHPDKKSLSISCISSWVTTTG